MRLRRLETAEMVRTPAGAWPGRGFGVLPGGSRRAVMPSASTSTARARSLSPSYRRRSQALLRHDAGPVVSVLRSVAG